MDNQEEILQQLHWTKQQLKLKEQMLNSVQEELEFIEKEKREAIESKDRLIAVNKHLNEKLSSTSFPEGDSELKAELERKTEELKSAQEEIAKLRETLDHHQSSNNDELEEQISSLMQREASARAEIDAAERRCMSLDEELSECRQQLASSHERVAELSSELEDLQQMMDSYQSALEASRERAAQERTEAAERDEHHAVALSKGNSLFAEVEDRRVVAEKELGALRGRIKSLHQQLNNEKQQHQRLQLQTSSLLLAAKGKHSQSYVKSLESDLRSARAEVQRLSMEINELRQEQESSTERVVPDGDSSIAQYREYVEALLAAKNRELERERAARRREQMAAFTAQSSAGEARRQALMHQAAVATARAEADRYKLLAEQLQADSGRKNKRKSSDRIIEKIPNYKPATDGISSNLTEVPVTKSTDSSFSDCNKTSSVVTDTTNQSETAALTEVTSVNQSEEASSPNRVVTKVSFEAAHVSERDDEVVKKKARTEKRPKKQSRTVQPSEMGDNCKQQ